MRSIEQQTDRGIELLTLCLKLQNEKDGIDRPDPFVIDKTKVLDQFAKDIGEAATNIAALRKLIPMMMQLAEVGRMLEKNGKIVVDYGDDYSEKALEFFIAKFSDN